MQHQNTVTIFDAGEEQVLAYIAMEFLKGTDLASATSEGNLFQVSKVLAIVAKVAEALAHAHGQHVVHRDIKLANIMYDPATEMVKVTGFGIARIMDSSRTKTGLVLGISASCRPSKLRVTRWMGAPICTRWGDAFSAADGKTAISWRLDDLADIQNCQ